jgi:hypothetical protein
MDRRNFLGFGLEALIFGMGLSIAGCKKQPKTKVLSKEGLQEEKRIEAKFNTLESIDVPEAIPIDTQNYSVLEFIFPYPIKSATVLGKENPSIIFQNYEHNALFRIAREIKESPSQQAEGYSLSLQLGTNEKRLSKLQGIRPNWSNKDKAYLIDFFIPEKEIMNLCPTGLMISDGERIVFDAVKTEDASHKSYIVNVLEKANDYSVPRPLFQANIDKETQYFLSHRWILENSVLLARMTPEEKEKYSWAYVPLDAKEIIKPKGLKFAKKPEIATPKGLDEENNLLKSELKKDRLVPLYMQGRDSLWMYFGEKPKNILYLVKKKG